MRRLLRKYPVPLLLSIEFTISAAVLLPFAIYGTTGEELGAVTFAGWFSLVYAAFFALIIGYTLHNWGLAKVGPFKSSVYGYLMPLSAALAGFFAFGEELGWYQISGGVSVLFAMYLVQSDRVKKTASA